MVSRKPHASRRRRSRSSRRPSLRLHCCTRLATRPLQSIDHPSIVVPKSLRSSFGFPIIMPSKKPPRAERPSIHPRNRYADSPPDFAALASLYPSFQTHVFYSRDGRPRIDWTDFNATRELTRVLLLHDHALDWWIPDGQLCPTVPNRSNYIHWIEDLLSSDIIPKNYHVVGCDNVRGFDIGTGANCILPWRWLLCVG